MYSYLISCSVKFNIIRGGIMIFKPEIVAGIAKTAHPYGCRQEVKNQIEYVKNGKQYTGAKKVLIIGASSGYGLSSRISMAFGGSNADTIGVSYESGVAGRRTGTAGWYNNIFFKEEAEKSGLIAKNFVGDAFSLEMKDQVIKYIKEEFGGKVDMVIYSLASARRVDPIDGKTYNSKLRTIGEPFSGPTIDVMTGKMIEKTVPAATEAEIHDTIKVMGGEDWSLWMNAMIEAGVLEKGARTIAYSYIGPTITDPIYTAGTIGYAKRHLEDTAIEVNKRMKESVEGEAYVSVNKALVTKASAFIPTFPVYAAVLFKIMKEMKLHESCIEQTHRLFVERVYSGDYKLDTKGRIRVDDWEMREDVQKATLDLWDQITEENFTTISDYEGYRKDFMQMNGFEIDGVDYEEDIDLEELKKLEY